MQTTQGMDSTDFIVHIAQTEETEDHAPAKTRWPSDLQIMHDTNADSTLESSFVTLFVCLCGIGFEFGELCSSRRFKG